jgi:hypothetical protein
MSVAGPTLRAMDLTAGQRRTLERLIGSGRAPAAAPAAAARLRLRLDEAARRAGLDPGRPLWLSKRRLDELAACEGTFQAGLAGEGPAFAHTPETAAGSLMHRALQLDVAVERLADVRSVVERAAQRLVEHDDGFAGYWRALDALDRAEVQAEAAAVLALFREMFPPLRRRWQPVAEQQLKARLAGGALVLSGRIDLMLGRGRRLLIDFKGGEARPAHAEDMRFYAVLATLVFDLPPYRVASVFLRSMEWQLEEVTEETLDLAATRLAAAVRVAAELGARPPALTPGRHCAWCPRVATCPDADRSRTGGDAGIERGVVPA